MEFMVELLEVGYRSSDSSPSNRNYPYPNATSSGYGSRLTFYIK